MSIRIEPTLLSESLVGREFVYLVTTGGERTHVVALRCEVEGDRATMAAAGRSASANIVANSRVTLVWPPTMIDVEQREYSIVADGVATIDGESGGGSVAVVITNAVFHRPAP